MNEQWTIFKTESDAIDFGQNVRHEAGRVISY